MVKLRVVEVRAKSWWKFWTSDNLEVVIDCVQGKGKRKTMTMHCTAPFSKSLLGDQIIDKYCTGDQFYRLHQRQKKILRNAKSLIGDTLDSQEEVGAV